MVTPDPATLTLTFSHPIPLISRLRDTYIEEKGQNDGDE